MHIVEIALTASGCMFLLATLVTVKNIILKAIRIQRIVKNSATVFGEILHVSENEEQLGKAQWISYSPTITYKVNGTQYVLENFKVTNAEPYYKGRVIVVTYNIDDPKNSLGKLEMNSTEYINAENPFSPKSLLTFLCTLTAGFVCLYFGL